MKAENESNYSKVFSLWLSNLEPVETILNRNGLLAFPLQVEFKEGIEKWKSSINKGLLQEVACSVGVLNIDDDE